MIPHTRTARARAPAPEVHVGGGAGAWQRSSPLLRPTLTEETVRQHGPHHSSDFSLVTRMAELGHTKCTKAATPLRS